LVGTVSSQVKILAIGWERENGIRTAYDAKQLRQWK
jgi:hypothetical protein